MFSWLVDHASLVYLLLGSAALVLGAAWWMTRQRKYPLALGVTAALIALVWLLGRMIVTDRQQIQNGLWAMAQGVSEGQPEAVFRHLAREFRFQGMDRAAFQAHAEKAIRVHRMKDLYLWQFDCEDLNRDARKARVAFNVRVTSDWTEGTQIFLVRADFVLEDGSWRMKGFDIFNPIVNTNTPVRVPLP